MSLQTLGVVLVALMVPVGGTLAQLPTGASTAQSSGLHPQFVPLWWPTITGINGYIHGSQPPVPGGAAVDAGVSTFDMVITGHLEPPPATAQVFWEPGPNQVELAITDQVRDRITVSVPANLVTVPGRHIIDLWIWATGGHDAQAYFDVMPRMSARTPAGGTSGGLYSERLASGGIGPYVATVASGGLPPGLSIDSDAKLTGVPMAPGTFNFSVRTVDAWQQTLDASYTVTVQAAPPIPTVTMPALALCALALTVIALRQAKWSRRSM
jgi:hypothetical protein